jgi:hypothetical protein
LLPSAAGGWNSIDGYTAALSWTAPGGGAASYVIRWSSDAYASSQGTTTATTFTKTALAADTSYTFKICSVNTEGAEEVMCAGPVSATTPPAAPTLPATSNVTATSVDVSWTAAAGATSAELKIFTDSACTSLDSTNAGIASPYTKTGLLTDRSYWYQLRSYSTTSGSFGPPTSCSAISGNGRTSITIGTDATSVSLGDTLLPGSDVTATSTITVQTYGSTGYQLSANVNALLTSGSNTIPATTSGTVGLPSGAGAGAWTGSGFGFTITNATNLETGWASGTNWARFATSGETIHDTGAAFTTNTTNTTTTGITYRLTVPNGQAPGTYSTTVTYTALGTP